MNLNEIITQMPINVYVVVACLVVGYIMKKWIPADNKVIPTVLAVAGAIIAIPISGFTAEVVIGGALSGLIAVGLHQAFKQMIEGKKETEGE